MFVVIVLCLLSRFLPQLCSQIGAASAPLASSLLLLLFILVLLLLRSTIKLLDLRFSCSLAMKKYWINIGSILEYLDQLDQLEYLNQYWINIGILLLESGSEAIGRSSL